MKRTRREHDKSEHESEIAMVRREKGRERGETVNGNGRETSSIRERRGIFGDGDMREHRK